MPQVLTSSVSAAERHAVAVYGSDDELVARVAAFVAEGLAAGEQVLVIATPAHRAALRQALPSGGFRALDAADTLGSFLVDGRVDAERFVTTVGAAVDQALATGPRVRAFGEMVALLWAAGNAAGALELEGLWNRLGATRPFRLLCGYPTSALADHPDLVDVNEVCQAHTRVLPPLSYPSPGPAAPAASHVFVPTSAAVPAARHWVAATLVSWDLDPLVEDAQLVTSELATNALRHAATAFRVSLSRGGAAGTVRIGFEDLGAAQPSAGNPGLDHTGGRGIGLVSDLSSSWGSEPTAAGKVVWAELAAG